ncbi:MAG: M48 family metalloprotease [Candidatus Parcubacteria bacterium]|nr:M48 family metalloprotease [Candidatus Parcubacteria bacterium]
MDLDMEKVRHVRIMARTVQYLVLVLLVFYILFCFRFTVLENGIIDGRFLLYSVVPIPYFLYVGIREHRDPASFIIKLNRLLGHGAHARYATDTERSIVKSFFDEKGYEMPQLFTCRPSDSVNVCIGYCYGTRFLLLTEETYWKCSPQEIWAILAHEVGHVLNRDMMNIVIENVIFYSAWWLSVLVMIKIFLFPIFHHGLWSQPPFYFLISYFVIFFLMYIREWLSGVLYLVKEILADNSGAQIVGSSLPLVSILERYAKNDGICLPKRISTLLWIQKTNV